jgi:hypothetical protein
LKNSTRRRRFLASASVSYVPNRRPVVSDITTYLSPRFTIIALILLSPAAMSVQCPRYTSFMGVSGGSSRTAQIPNHLAAAPDDGTASGPSRLRRGRRRELTSRRPA